MTESTVNQVNAVEFLPENYFAHLPLDALFSQPAPLEVDIGSGPGRFLLAMARKFPDHNFLGIERLVGRVRKTCEAALRLDLCNVRILRLESAYAVRHLLPSDSVSTFHVAFPDPWPKRKHWPRRLFNAEFLAAVTAALQTGGELRIKTDDAVYFDAIRKTLAENFCFQQIEWPEDPDYPQTNFERRFRAKGLEIYRLRLVKT